MNDADDDLSKVALFAPRFVTALAALVGAMPFLDRLASVLPLPMQYADLGTALSAVAAYAVIGREFLRRRPTLDERLTMAGDYMAGSRLPTGGMMLFAGVGLLIGYTVYARLVLAQGRLPAPLEEVCLLLTYIAIFVCLARGLWQMAFREYARRNDPFARARRAPKAPA